MKRIVLSLCILSLFLFAAVQAEAQVKLTVGKAVAKTFEFIPADIGVELGFFKKRGLDVNIAAFRGSGPLETALAAGSVDIALDAAASITAAVGKGVPARLVALIGDKPYLMVLIVGKESGIRAKEDLRGKKIGVTSHGALTDWLVKRVEENMGWPKDSITRVPLGAFTGQAAGLKTGAIAGFVWSADGAWDAEEKGLGKILFSFGEILPGIAFEAIEAHNKLIKENPRALQGFLEGWFEAVRYMKANKDYTVRKIAAILDVSPEVARKTYELDIGNLSSDGVIPKVSLDYVLKSHVADGLFASPPDLKTIYNQEFVPVRLR